MSRKTSLFLVALAALGMNVLTTTPATASSVYSKTATLTSSVPPFESWCVTIRRSGEAIGRACFEHYGDKFWIKDTKADGAGIYMWGELSPAGDTFKCYNNGGADAGWQRCGFASEMKEDQVIVFAGYARKDGNNNYGTSDFQMTNTSG